MSVYDVLENPSFVAQSLVDMIANERNRIVASKLVPNDKLKIVVGNAVDGIMKVAKKNNNRSLALLKLSELHDLLKSIRLPGDFEKLAAEEDPEGEKFYDLSGIIKKLKELEKSREDEAEEAEQVEEEAYIDLLRKDQEYHQGPHEDFAKDEGKELPCGCKPGGCADDADHKCTCTVECPCKQKQKSAQMALAETINNRLEKIAYALGTQGAHDAAYLVERTMRDIKNEAETDKLFERGS